MYTYETCEMTLLPDMGTSTDVIERELIFEIYLPSYKFGPDLDVSRLVRGTEGGGGIFLIRGIFSVCNYYRLSFQCCATR